MYPTHESLYYDRALSKREIKLVVKYFTDKYSIQGGKMPAQARPVTLVEIRKLIKEISRVTHDNEYGSAFSALLSAMRGPDFGDYGLKERTTAYIRKRLDWYCGTMANRLPADWTDLVTPLPTSTKEKTYHFTVHIRQAVYAMETLGLIKFPKNWKRGKK